MSAEVIATATLPADVERATVTLSARYLLADYERPADVIAVARTEVLDRLGDGDWRFKFDIGEDKMNGHWTVVCQAVMIS